MGLIDKFKGFVGAEDTEYDENADGDLFEDEDAGYDHPGTQPTDDYQRRATPQGAPSYTGNASGFNAAIELRVVKPTDFGSVTLIADHLLSNRTVVLNLEATNKDTARRLIDFLSGIAYSIKGQLKRVANNTYVITPNNVDVSGEQLKSEHKEEPKPEPAADDLYSNL